MAIALVSSVSAGPGASGGTTAAIDTTGATLLIISVGWYNATSAVPTAVTDSKSNTWVPLPVHTGSTGSHRLYYALGATVGTGHTFTVTAANFYPAIFAYAFSGVGAYATENGAGITSGTSLSSGVVTPTENGALIFSGVSGAGNATTDTITPSGFSAVNTLGFISGTRVQGSAAYQIQAVATAITPTWGFSPSQTAAATSSAVFQVTPIPNAIRVTQAPVETLARAPVDLRVTQTAVEVLGTTVATVVTAIRVTQAPVETLAAAPVALRVTQAPVEVLYTLLPRGWKVLIGGVDRTGIVDAASFSWVLNERARATLTLGDFLPNKFDEVLSYAKDGTTPIFGGVIVTRNYTGRNQYDPTFTVTLECADWFIYTDWTYVSESYDVPTPLKVVLGDLVAGYLAPYGIGLYPGQADGPALDPFVWSNKRLSDAIRELTDRTGWVAEITPAKRLRMFAPGTDPAPFDLTEAAPHCQEVGWTDSDRTVANKVTIIAGPNGQRDVENEIHHGDGVTTVFPLYAPYVHIIGALSEMRDGVLTGMYLPVGVVGQDDPTLLSYMYDPSINAIVPGGNPRPVLAANEGFNIWYGAAFPFSVSAWNGATPVIEQVEARPDVLSIPAAQEIANGLLAQLSGAAKELAIRTDEDGFLVGQALHVDLPITRHLPAATHTITEVGLQIVQDTGPDDEYRVYTLKATESPEYQGSYLDDWRRITVSPSTVTGAEGGGS